MLQADVYSRCNLGLSRIRAYAVWCAPGVRRVLARIRRAPGGVRRAYHPRRVGLGARSVAEAPGRRRGAEAPRAVHCVSWTSVRDFAGGAAIAAQRGRSAELETAAVPRLAFAPAVVPRRARSRRSVGVAAVSRGTRRGRAPSRPRSAPPPRIWRGHEFARPRARRRRRSPRSDAFSRAPARPSFGGAVPPCAPGPLASSVSAREVRVACQTRPRAACRLQRLAALVPEELGPKRLRTRCCALVRRGARGLAAL